MIRRSYLTNIVINIKPLNSEYQCNDYQGIMLHYGYYSFNDSISEIAHSKCITIIQNVSVYHDSRCNTDRGIIFVNIEEYQRVDSIEIIIVNSQFNDVFLQPIIDIKDDSITTGCKIWIINCTFESIITVDHISIITAEVSQFNTALIFFNCEFRYCSASEKYLVAIFVTTEMNFRNVSCTNITFNKCNFSNNDGGLLSFVNTWLSYCQLHILLVGPTNINKNGIISDSANLIYIESTAIDSADIHIYGPVNISNNEVHNNDIMVFQLCNVFLKGPLTISSNVAFERNVILLESCNVSLHGPITISQHLSIDSVILFTACDITFDKQIMFISNICKKIITIKLKYTYIKVMQNTNITFLTNQCSDDVIVFELDNDHNKPYPYCLFQYVTTKTNTSTIMPENYTIIISEHKNSLKMIYSNLNKCRVTFDHYTSHCKWLPTSVFHGHNPGLINQQIIQINYRKINHHNFICVLNSTTQYDCAIDTLDPVYPGQILQIDVFTPCSENTSVIYAETHNNLLPSAACKIARQTELLIIVQKH